MSIQHFVGLWRDYMINEELLMWSRKFITKHQQHCTVGMSGQLNNKLTELIFTHLQCMHVDIVVTCMFLAIHMVVQSVDSEK